MALLDEILEVARYMDQNEGRLPVFAPPVITSGHPSESLSEEELEEFFANKKAQKQAEQVMHGDEWVFVSDETFAGFLKFFDVPPIFSQRRGEALSRAKREIRDELSFQASDKLRDKRTDSESPESLASRIYRVLDGVPRSGKWKGEHKKVI